MDLPVLPPLEPMLAKATAKVPDDPCVWSYEPKWDGLLYWTVSRPFGVVSACTKCA